MNSSSAFLAWCPFPDRESARAIAGTLLDENLIGCANMVGEIESLFEWDGERGSGQEIAVLFKTSALAVDRFVDRLGELHPYDTPAIVAWGCERAHPATLEWLGGIGAEVPS